MRLYQQMASEGRLDVDVARKFLRHVDRADPWQLQRATGLEEELTRLGLWPEP